MLTAHSLRSLETLSTQRKAFFHFLLRGQKMKISNALRKNLNVDSTRRVWLIFFAGIPVPLNKRDQRQRKKISLRSLRLCGEIIKMTLLGS
jgi:hypothetical protein